MTFYDDKLKRSVLYVTPEGTEYIIGVYGEEHPEGGTETVTGMPERVTESEKESYIESAKQSRVSESSEKDKSEVPQSAVESLRRRLSEENAP